MSVDGHVLRDAPPPSALRPRRRRGRLERVEGCVGGEEALGALRARTEVESDGWVAEEIELALGEIMIRKGGHERGGEEQVGTIARL